MQCRGDDLGWDKVSARTKTVAQSVVAIAGDDLKSAQGLIGCFGPHPSS